MELVKLAEKSKCKVLISNLDTELTRELYKNAFKTVSIEIRRSISADANSRKNTKELLAIYI
jgi:DNA adenine methylase